MKILTISMSVAQINHILNHTNISLTLKKIFKECNII
uniref:HTH_48 domain-containing protein n=1 Tax=Heterorhabditis bacteriophora TaxID=37862 RepID=A0A1I7WIA1_HETBA